MRCRLGMELARTAPLQTGLNLAQITRQLPRLAVALALHPTAIDSPGGAAWTPSTTRHKSAYGSVRVEPGIARSLSGITHTASHISRARRAAPSRRSTESPWRSANRLARRGSRLLTNELPCRESWTMHSSHPRLTRCVHHRAGRPP
jgi:hypothetical protein